MANEGFDSQPYLDLAAAAEEVTAPLWQLLSPCS